MPRLSVQQLFDDRRERLGLEWIAGAAGSAREITGTMLARPGVGLIGHLNLIHPLMVQVLGRSELEYLESLDPASREMTALRAVGGETVALIVCDGMPVPSPLQDAAAHVATPLLASPEPSQQVINVLRPYLQQELG